MKRVLRVKIKTLIGDKELETKELVIPVGMEYVLKKIDESLKTKKPGDEYELTLKPEQAYGNRSSNLVKLIPMKYFKNDRVNPYPGLVINVDGAVGMVRSVSPGRVMVDFNHPLAGKTMNYKIKVLEELKNKVQVAQEIVKAFTGKTCKAKLMDKKIHIEMTKIPEQQSTKMTSELKDILGINVELTPKKA